MKKLALFSFLASALLSAKQMPFQMQHQKQFWLIFKKSLLLLGLLTLKARQTPIAVGRITAQGSVKVGNMEFPEILNKTPGVYATKQGGGYGDSHFTPWI